MTKISTLFTLLLVAISSFGQLKEGHISFKINVTADKPEMQMQVGMMQGSSLDIYFKEKVTRSEFTMGTMMKMVTITNPEKDAMLLLMSGMLGTKAIKSSISDAKKQTENTPEVNVKLEVETKEILGFICKKALVTDGEGNESVYWYTNELNVDKNGQNMMNDKIPGVALEYEISQQGLKMVMSAITIDKKLDKKAKDLFEMTIPEGYTEVSAEDLQKLGQ